MMVLADPDPRRIARVLTTWFGSADPADRSVRPQPRWFAKDPAFDRALRDTFGEDVDAARRGLLDRWQHTPAGLLALCILIDQWSRNLHRDIIVRFGRYPHRNAVLGRATTPDEAAFLLGPDSSF